MNYNNKNINEIKERLSSLEKNEALKKSINGFLNSLLIIIGTLAAVFLLESVFNFSSDFRTYIFYSVLIYSVILLLKNALYPLLIGFGIIRKPDYFEIASRVGSKFPYIKDELVNSLQLITDTNNFGNSPQLIEKAFERTYNNIKHLDFLSIIDYSSTKKIFRNTASAAALFILFLFIPFLQNAAVRVLNYDKEFITPPKFSFVVEPGNAKVTKGEDLSLKISVKGETPDLVSLYTKTKEESEYNEVELTPDSSGQFTYYFASLNSSFFYYAAAQNINSTIYNVEVINRPVVRSLELTVTSPSYSKIPRAIYKDNGNIAGLPGSRIDFKLNSTKNISSAVIRFDNDSEKVMEVRNDSGFAKIRISESINYYIDLTDEDGNTNSNPVTYSITSLDDEYPMIDVLAPDQDVKLSNQNNLSLETKISDDYGFKKLVLNYKLSASRYEEPWTKFVQIEIPFNNKSKEEIVYYNWNLKGLNLAVEDVVSYFIEVFDNDVINGPKSVKSQLYKLSVPSLDELFNKADETQQLAENELKETLDEAEKLKDEFEKISDELKQDNKELTFEEKEKIKNVLDKFEKLGNKVEEIQKQLSEMQEKLNENDLLSQETLEKYLELQELMDELTGEEYKEALQKMQEMMEQLQRNQTQNAFEEMKLNEENFKKSIERTLNLLKRIQVEQKVDELLKRSEELANKQEELREQTEKNKNNGNQKDLDKKQEEISKELNDFKEELEKLQNKLSELPDLPQEEMQNIMEEFEKQNNDELSEEAEENIKKNQMQQAMKSQQQLAQNMQKMNQQLQEMQSQMQMQNQMQTLQDMMKIIDNILAVSKEQEKLKDKSSQLSFNSPQLGNNAKKQNELRNDLSKILQQMGKASQKTFAITPEMAKAIGMASTDMNESINSMQNGNSTSAAQNQNSAMANLNEAATMMNNMMQSMMNGGGSGGGMMSLMQQMQQLSQQQMQLNQMTQMMNQGILSQEQMGQLQRLAGEQEMIRKSLEQLNKESKQSGQSKKMPANLERILEDMKEVVSDMQTQKLGNDLIQKQERILSKLLDAQRSINERDFEKERESFAGENIKRDSPPELLLNSEEGRNKLRDELLKAIREGYLKDYEDLIRYYYEALQKEEIK